MEALALATTEMKVKIRTSTPQVWSDNNLEYEPYPWDLANPTEVEPLLFAGVI